MKRVFGFIWTLHCRETLVFLPSNKRSTESSVRSEREVVSLKPQDCGTKKENEGEIPFVRTPVVGVTGVGEGARSHEGFRGLRTGPGTLFWSLLISTAKVVTQTASDLSFSSTTCPSPRCRTVRTRTLG